MIVMRSGYKQGRLPLWWGGVSGSQQSSSGPSQPRCGRVKGERRIEMVAPVECAGENGPTSEPHNSGSPSWGDLQEHLYQGPELATASWLLCRGWERGRWWISHVGAALGQVLAEGGMAPAQSLYPAQSLTPLNSPLRALQESLPHGPRKLTPLQSVSSAGWWRGVGSMGWFSLMEGSGQLR